jgi:hypothetical protein
MIIRDGVTNSVNATSLNLFPDQFVSYKTKQQKKWIKENLDYFTTIAISQYVKNKNTFVHNYNLVKGIIRKEDFYLQDEAGAELKSFSDKLIDDVGLPPHVQHYPILNPPLNSLIGEQGKRPDEVRVKAFDDDSKNEELSFKTDFLQQQILDNAKQTIMMTAAQQGQQIPDDQVVQMAEDKVKEYMTDYTSTAEKWANRTLEALKVEFNTKEISEDCFRDLLISNREFYHIYEANTKTGLGVENLNPKNVWYLTLPDKKYMKSAYAIGTAHIMELSEILNRFNLSKEEIDELKNGREELGMLKAKESNLNIPSAKGWGSIKYDTYSPLVMQQRMLAESELRENSDPLGSWLGVTSNVNTFGNKYIVIQAYWQSKIRIGQLTFIDEQGKLQTKLVDETYQTIPNEVDIQWEYDNRWYRGLNISNRVYQAEPLELLDYSPIIGVVHEIKNVDEGKSFIDLLKPYQAIYNVCLNQLWMLLDKEIGNVYLSSIRHIPTPKDGDPQDALDMWEQEARQRGILQVDDSPENLKSPSNFNMFKSVDLTRSNEMQTRYQIAMQMKIEAWELVGITRERLGSVAATQTATGTNAAVSQSYAQTEPYFMQHEYVFNDVCQALLDAAQFIETKKPFSTLSFVNTLGEQIFLQVNTDDIKMRDLKVFATSRSEDKEAIQSMRNLSQTILQNGGTPYDVSILYTTNSVRQMRQVYKDLRDKMYAVQAQQQQLEQTKVQQQQEQFQAVQQAQEKDKQDDMAFQGEQKQLDRINQKEIALIRAESVERSALNATPESGAYEVGEYEKLSQEQSNKDRDYQIKIQERNNESNKRIAEIRLQLEKINVEREKIQNDLLMKRIDQSIAKSKPKVKTK